MKRTGRMSDIEQQGRATGGRATGTSGSPILSRRNIAVVVAIAVLVTWPLVWPAPWPYAAVACLCLVMVVLSAKKSDAEKLADRAETGAAAWPDSAMKAAVNAVPQPAIILDARGVVRFVNDGAAETFPAARTGDPFTLSFRAPRIGEAVRHFPQAEVVEFEHRDNAQSRIFAVCFNPVRLPGNASTFMLALFEDRTERLVIDRMRSDFIANASHELRTPLASVSGFIETLLGPARNDPVASERFLHIMQEQAARMRRLIDDLLALSRAEMKSHRRPKDIVDLVMAARYVRDALDPVARDLGVSLEVDLPAAPVEVLGERDDLVQVLENLVENAIKYGAAGKRVLIAVAPHSPESRFATVKVRDWGPGIASEHQPRLTERFYRVDAEVSRQNKGTGLGLAIAKHILTRHGGRLNVESKPGSGATFTISLPARETNKDEVLQAVSA